MKRYSASLVTGEKRIKTTSYYFNQLGWLLSKRKKKQKITSVGEDVEDSELPCTAAAGNSLAAPQKVKHRIII